MTHSVNPRKSLHSELYYINTTFVILGPTLVILGAILDDFRPKLAQVFIYKPLEIILGNFYENRVLLIATVCTGSHTQCNMMFDLRHIKEYFLLI